MAIKQQRFITIKSFIYYIFSRVKMRVLGHVDCVDWRPDRYIAPGQIHIVPRHIYDLVSNKYEYEYENKYLYIAPGQIYIAPRQIHIAPGQIYDLMSDKYEYEYDNKYLSKHKYQSQ